MTGYLSIKRTSIIVYLAFVFSFVLCGPAVLAQNTADLCTGANLTFTATKCNNSGDVSKNAEGRVNNLIATVVNIFSIIVGVVAVIMIIYAGFKFITSGGDSGNVTSARNTIIYAIIGLIIVALAQIIVKFVLVKLSGSPNI